MLAAIATNSEAETCHPFSERAQTCLQILLSLTPVRQHSHQLSSRCLSLSLQDLHQGLGFCQLRTHNTEVKEGLWWFISSAVQFVKILTLACSADTSLFAALS